MNINKVSYGLDISGFSTKGGSSLVRAERNSQTDGIKIDIIEGHCFQEEHKGKDCITEIVNKETAIIEKCFKEGLVFVDTPIDLQGLPDPDNPYFVWQLTKRPVDKAFRALSPLSDRIGAPVSRFRNIRKKLACMYSECLGELLYETYPAASLKLMGLSNEKYKGDAYYQDSKWYGKTQNGRSKNEKDQNEKDRNLADILNKLEWHTSSKLSINHNEFDAALCAIIGVSQKNDWLQGDDLKRDINNILLNKGKNIPFFEAPKGYVLLKKQPKFAEIARINISYIL
ncbi:MAG: hypothetical protein WCX65_08065 [bacterium]